MGLVNPCIQESAHHLDNSGKVLNCTLVMESALRTLGKVLYVHHQRITLTSYYVMGTQWYH